ncbi:MAG: hypothetical protein WBM00_05730 [Solirubrobacterales bacterium]
MASRGLFYARLEDRDWIFIEELGDQPPFDGCVIRASYLAAYPPEDHRHGQDHDLLAKAMEKKGWRWALDPHTAPHLHHRAHEWTAPRARNCQLAQALSLPWTLDGLAAAELRGELIDRCVSLQESAGPLAAPYVEVDRREQRATTVNCELITATAERAVDQRVLAYLQALPGTLRDGTADEAARRFVEAGAETIFIRIRGFDSSNFDQVIAYLELVEAIEAEGARAVADSAGYFGAVAVAGGADAMIAGARYFRTVPATLLSRPVERSEEDGENDKEKEKAKGGGQPLCYELSGLLDSVAPGEEAARLALCPEPGCRPADLQGKPALIRAHNFHEFRRMSHLAAEAGPQFAQTLRGIGSPTALLWASALDQRAERRRAS